MPEHALPVVHLPLSHFAFTKWRFGQRGLTWREIRKHTGSAPLAFAPERLNADDLT